MVVKIKIVFDVSYSSEKWITEEGYHNRTNCSSGICSARSRSLCLIALWPFFFLNIFSQSLWKLRRHLTSSVFCGKFRLTLWKKLLYLFIQNQIMPVCLWWQEEQSLSVIYSPASWHQGLQKSLSFTFFHFEMQLLLNTSLCEGYCITLIIFVTLLLHFCNSIIFFLRWESALQAIPKRKRCLTIHCSDNAMFFLKFPNIPFAF